MRQAGELEFFLRELEVFGGDLRQGYQHAAYIRAMRPRPAKLTCIL